MSLDLYIKAKKPIKKQTSGIFTRENGTTKEVLTLKEFMLHFPNSDKSQFQLYEYEEEDLWHANITHNLTEMASHIISGDYNFYQLLWRPNENGFKYATSEYRNLIYNGLVYMLKCRKYLSQYYNPKNGWG